jgi:hypothetical protein
LQLLDHLQPPDTPELDVLVGQDRSQSSA